MNLEQEEKKILELASHLNHLQKSVERERMRLEQATEEVVHTQEAQAILQHLAQAVQHQAHRKISEVVSSCLSAVFEDPYTFHIDFQRKRGRTEAQLRFKRRDLDADPLTASGGGVIDVAAFALRIACLMLHRPRLARVVVMDEPFKFVSSQYRHRVGEMLEDISKKMSLQIVMVTHIEELETGKVVTL